MTEYKSIKEDVLRKLEENLPEIQNRFGVETIGIFGSAARGEDNENSDADVFCKFKDGIKTYHAMLSLADYLEELFGRKVDMVSPQRASPYFRKYIDSDAIVCRTDYGEA